jgi:nucleotidyltransferase/DNA polymerase involved in DNA repair
MDAFFAAVEAREDPSIAGQPIVVGADPQEGRGRGVVAACNYEARKFGIHSAMPISEAYRRCSHAVFLRPRSRLYADISERIIHIFESFTEMVEKISIDEAFLDVTGSVQLFGDGVTIARRIKQDVLEQERLTVSIGIAPNKFLAKLASDLEKPDGLTVVEPGAEREFLHPLPVERLWGVGDVTARKLHQLGIWTIGDIADSPTGLLERQFGKHSGSRLRRLSRGEDERPRLAPFETHTKRHTVEEDLTTTESVWPIARQLFAAADPGDRPIRLIGVGVSGLHEREQPKQLGLFEDADPAENAERVADVMDRVSDKYGKGAIKRGKLIQGNQDEES